MELQIASRKRAKIKMALQGTAGSGKTMSALLIAFGLTNDWTKIAVVDSENHSAELYSHLGQYNVVNIVAPFSPEKYMDAIHLCERGGMEVIIIDSISHEWEGKGGVLELADALGGQYQSAWKTLTPRHEAFKQAIIQSPCHIITTVRRKQDYVLQEKLNKHGKMVQAPVKAGFKEVTREGWEYELTVNLELELNHYATASKDRTNLFMGKPPFVPSEETGRMISEWCNQGLEPVPIEDRISSCKSMNELLALFQSADIDNQNLNLFSQRKLQLQSPKKNNNETTTFATR